MIRRKLAGCCSRPSGICSRRLSHRLSHQGQTSLAMAAAIQAAQTIQGNSDSATVNLQPR